jgi:hypothetical protein
MQPLSTYRQKPLDAIGCSSVILETSDQSEKRKEIEAERIAVGQGKESNGRDKFLFFRCHHHSFEKNMKSAKTIGHRRLLFIVHVKNEAPHDTVGCARTKRRRPVSNVRPVHVPTRSRLRPFSSIVTPTHIYPGVFSGMANE